MTNTYTNTKDQNRDPITGAPGAHPVGTGVGAASGGVAGAAVGTVVGGPVGAVVGAAVGAIAGGLAGAGLTAIGFGLFHPRGALFGSQHWHGPRGAPRVAEDSVDSTRG